jgi:hypothetical protein
MTAIQSSQPSLPPGTKEIIIFDTNAYRVATWGLDFEGARTRAALLRGLEKKAGIFALAGPTVIWELAKHLPDEKDPARAFCMNAMVALAEHTWSPYGAAQQDGVCIFADAESTICRELFGSVPPMAEANTKLLRQIAAHIREAGPNITDTNVLGTIKAFADKMDAIDAEWLVEMGQLIGSFDPALARVWIGGRTDKDVRKKLRDLFVGVGFRQEWSARQIIHNAAIVGLNLSGPEVVQKITDFERVFEVPISMMQKLICLFASDPNVNLHRTKKPWPNMIWDTALAFAIGPHHEIDSVPITIVTGDGDIFDAATEAGCSSRVATLDDYFARVGMPTP